jgi:hypothetical protein
MTIAFDMTIVITDSLIPVDRTLAGQPNIRYDNGCGNSLYQILKIDDGCVDDSGRVRDSSSGVTAVVADDGMRNLCP